MYSLLKGEAEGGDGGGGLYMFWLYRHVFCLGSLLLLIYITEEFCRLFSFMQSYAKQENERLNRSFGGWDGSRYSLVYPPFGERAGILIAGWLSICLRFLCICCDVATAALLLFNAFGYELIQYHSFGVCILFYRFKS